MSESFEMADEDRSEIIAEYLSESDQHIQRLNELLLKAEELLKSGQQVSADDVNAMFRAAHTIKGSSSFLAFTTITHLTHQMETVLDRVRNNELPLTVPIIDVLFSAFDNLNSLLNKLRNEGNDKGEIAETIAKIEVVLSGKSAEKAPVTSPVPQAQPTAAQPEPQPVSPPPSVSAPAEPVAQVPLATSPSSVQQVSNADDVAQYLPAYIEDTEQNIERFNTLLMALEKKDFKKDYLNVLFRLAHTIKGSSGIIKRKDIETLAHRMEDFLSGYRDRGTPPDDDTLAILFKGIDWIKERVDALHQGNNALGDVSEILKEFEKLKNASTLMGNASTSSVSKSASAPAATMINMNDLSAAERNLVQKACGENQNVWRLTASIAASCSMKAMKASIIEERLNKLGVLIKASLPVTQIDDKYPDRIYPQYLFSTMCDQEAIRAHLSMDQVEIVGLEREEINKMSEPVPAAKPTVAASAPVAAVAKEAVKTPVESKAAAVAVNSVEVTSMRIDTRKLDVLMNLAGELVITRARFGQLVSELIDEVSQTKEISARFQEVETSLAQLKMDLREASSAQTQTASPDKFNKFFEHLTNNFLDIRETLTMKSVRGKVYNLDEATSSLDKLSSDIQNAVMQTRMVQIETVFSRFKRLVRDIARDVNKNVALQIYVEDTELDKKIVDELGDPLTHMIRNAVDHGLETKDERAKTNKPDTCTVTLGAMHKGNNICIEISDDGRGINVDRVVQKALDKGLYTQDQLDQMSDRDKINIIFAPGFSTAEKVTGLSGRGVGMDVVKKMIESLNGSVDIETEIGKGSKFFLKIPLTLAIIQALLVVVNDEIFALPLEAVSEIVKVTGKDVYSIEGNATIKLRDHALSLVNLEDVIKIQNVPKKEDVDQQVVVVTDGDEFIGISVDRLIGEDEIVIKSLPEHFGNVRGISGASILGNGRIALILDIATIMRDTQ